MAAAQQMRQSENVNRLIHTYDMARKRTHAMSFDKVGENIDRSIDDEEDDQGDNLNELYDTPELDGDSDEEDDGDLNTTQGDDDDEPIIRKKVYPKKILTKNRLVHSIGKLFLKQWLYARTLYFLFACSYKIIIFL